jgi:peptidoglycan DL-endopeptidase LytF
LENNEEYAKRVCCEEMYMNYFNHFELKQSKNTEGEYELVIFLDDFTTEFGNEFAVKTEKNDNLLDSAKRLIATHYPGLKVSMVRVMVSGLVFATFPIATMMASAQSSNGNEAVQATEGTSTYQVQTGDTLWKLSQKFNVPADDIRTANHLIGDKILIGQVLTIPQDINTTASNDTISAPTIHSQPSSMDNQKTFAAKRGNNWLKISPDNQFTKKKEELKNSSSFLIHKVVSGDTIWDISVKYGIPQYEILKVNSLKLDSPHYVGQQIKVPQYQIAVKQTVSSQHGEHLDWWTEAQYVVPIGTTFKVTDFATGKSFMVKRTIGANHADSETVTAKDSAIAKGIWKGFSWNERPVIIEVDGRKIAASMSFMPHDVDYIKDNGINGHFDIHFKNSTRHKDGKVDYDHQKQVNIAAGVQAK